ncbi:hypothetical protein LCGC14_1275310 [marine sediment metagenome]|uniref:HNH nuclease domain-containing protein n=1 Tax=marine sediment metagenome TaxID=412755 RepID=A0A0F9NDL0_9ZZZZ
MSPPAIKTPCCRCRKAAEGRYCERCRKVSQREASNNRRQRAGQSVGRAIRDTRRWRDRLSPMFLRSNPLCAQCERDGRQAFATEVHHVAPVSEEPERAFDESNLEALCKPCHSRMTIRESGSANPGATKAGKMATITIVCGPPGSGKNTWIDKHRKHGDVVIDLDTITAALTGLPLYEKPAGLLDYMIAVKDAAIALLRKSSAGRAWVITGGATEGEREKYKRMCGADQVVMLAVDPQECLKRIRGDPRRADKWRLWEPAVQRWWKRYDGKSEGKQ